MISIDRLAETAFQPGNLVHGTRLGSLPRLIDEGIQTGHRHKPNSLTPHDICFALLSTNPLPERYSGSSHRGLNLIQEGWISEGVNILVSRIRLQERFPKDLRAVGYLFWDEAEFGDNREHMLKSLYEYSSVEESVFGIPIEETNSFVTFGEEVRLQIEQDKEDSVDIDLWEGLVVEPEQVDRVIKVIALATRRIHLPIFSSDTKFLTLI